MNTCAVIAMHSCGRSAAIGWMRMNSGARRSAQSSRVSGLRARARDVGGGARCGRIHDFPRQRRAVRGVFADEPVQVRRARARQADDEHGCGDALVARCSGLRRAPLPCAASCRAGSRELAHRDPAERRELGLVAVRLQQPLERLGEVPRAVVASPGAAIARRGATNRRRAPAARRRAGAAFGRPSSSRGPRS